MLFSTKMTGVLMSRAIPKAHHNATKIVKEIKIAFKRVGVSHAVAALLPLCCC